ncbi:DUF4136 domain-containing protein [Marixanthomonas spongiae]|uniref:DUF4136 domain-containing protein n=1 Tax=Marixanthomonas spongiae TaxID=2174845 RepID=A0A2U0HZM8_9FLAO|nr:DUF4136 domain-containing protein [Marixanthomonas spongiae]PVW14323.1 DUF4136 domain-containing protein [Marixanthomonas spongiae]
MKTWKLIPIMLLLVVASSCSTVKVATDYDRKANFDTYNTYAFYKPGIDKAEINDLDKKRILRAIDAQLSAKGLVKSKEADLLVSIFTKERERVDVYNNNFGYGWGWSPWYYGSYYGSSVSRSTEGSLYIDLIDAKTNELVWQGIGSARLISDGNIEAKEKRIREIVSEILAEYPPGTMKK